MRRFVLLHAVTFAWVFVGMANFAEHAVTVDASVIDGLGRLDTVLSSDGPLLVHQGRLVVPALGFVWLAEH